MNCIDDKPPAMPEVIHAPAYRFRDSAHRSLSLTVLLAFVRVRVGSQSLRRRRVLPVRSLHRALSVPNFRLLPWHDGGDNFPGAVDICSASCRRLSLRYAIPFARQFCLRRRRKCARYWYRRALPRNGDTGRLSVPVGKGAAGRDKESMMLKRRAELSDFKEIVRA